jgi:NAD(P)-dependent dehydrogenase (short-subunit alcohol dehydrogenase family)
MGRLDGKVAIVTGSGKGMGRAIATRFAEEGASVVVSDVDDESGDEALLAITGAGGTAVYQHADVTVEADIVGLVNRAVSEFGQLNVMYNNAGGGRSSGLDASIEDWDYDHALNVRAAWLGIKHSMPELKKVGGGSIISTASVTGMRPLPAIHGYATFKAGLIMLTVSAAQELGPHRIRVNAIAPGWTITPALVGTLPGDLEDAKRIASKAQPIPRHGRPEDIANCALFLASDESDFITGVTIPVDGGFMTLCVQTPEVEAEVRAVVEKTGNAPLYWRAPA